MEELNTTDEEQYESVKQQHKEKPELVINPEKWKAMKEKLNKHEGKVWSK